MSKESEVAAEVRKAIARGRRVEHAVRDITLKALSGRGLDRAAVRKVTRDAFSGVRIAAATNGEAIEAVRQAARGVDKALAHAAQALKLSIEEAAARSGEFSRSDLARARSNLADMEDIFVDTLRDTARGARGAAAQVLGDLLRHARASGTAVGRELDEMKPLPGRLARAARDELEAGADAALTTGALLARAASGVLAGIADSLSRPRKAAPRRHA